MTLLDDGGASRIATSHTAMPDGGHSAHAPCALAARAIHSRAFAVPSSAQQWDYPRVPRFLTLADISEALSVSAAQAYALVRSGELRAIKVGGRGQWRVEEAELEAYIQRMYAETAEFVRTHPFGAEE